MKKFVINIIVEDAFDRALLLRQINLNYNNLKNLMKRDVNSMSLSQIYGKNKRKKKGKIKIKTYHEYRNKDFIYVLREILSIRFDYSRIIHDYC